MAIKDPNANQVTAKPESRIGGRIVAEQVLRTMIEQIAHAHDAQRLALNIEVVDRGRNQVLLTLRDMPPEDLKMYFAAVLRDDVNDKKTSE